jgi:hypothetical protein
VGQDGVVIADEKPEPPEEKTGAPLVAALRKSPHRQIEIEPTRIPMPVRDVDL